MYLINCSPLFLTRIFFLCVTSNPLGLPKQGPTLRALGQCVFVPRITHNKPRITRSCALFFASLWRLQGVVSRGSDRPIPCFSPLILLGRWSNRRPNYDYPDPSRPGTYYTQYLRRHLFPRTTFVLQCARVEATPATPTI